MSGNNVEFLAIRMGIKAKINAIKERQEHKLRYKQWVSTLKLKLHPADRVIKALKRISNGFKKNKNKTYSYLHRAKQQ